MTATGGLSSRRWQVLAGCALIVAFGMPALWGSTLGLFLKPIQQELGWTRADIAFSMTINTVLGLALVTAAGWLIDRVRLRPLIVAGVLLQSAGIATLSLLGGSVWNFYALCVVLMVCGTGASIMTISKLVRNWFDESLGKAMGILFAAAGMGGILMPLIAQALIQEFGWRQAYVGLAALGLLVAAPAAWWAAEDRDASPAAPPAKENCATAAAESARRAPPFRTLLAERSWWVLMIWNLLFGYAAAGIGFHFAPMLQDRGATLAQSALALSLMGAGGLAGNLVLGWLMDRLPVRFLAKALMLAPMCAVILLYLSDRLGVALFAAVVFGVCAASENSLMAFLVGRYFGSAMYGRAYSNMFIAGALGSGLSPWVVGLMQQGSGNYDQALIVAAVVLAAAVLVISRLPPTPEPASAASGPASPVRG